MDLQTFLAILGGIVSLGAVVVAVARYFVRNQRQLDALRQEIKTLQEQSRGFRKAMRAYPERASTDTFDRLVTVSAETANSVRADIHSISVPVPLHTPTDLRIIHSTDTEAAKVLGREFPITEGIAGWVFKTQKPYFQNEARADPRHFGLVDQAARTRTGEGAILTIPLVAGGRCHGVIQLMKPKGGAFSEDDVVAASRFAPTLTRLLIELEESPTEDIPSIAHGNVIATSILFSDIRAFSEIASKIRLQTSVELLNEYYSRLLSFALTKGGKLQEYVGDGLFISFSLDRPATSARAAVLTAVEMQGEFDEILYSWRQYNHPVSPRNTHSIGIATGLVHAGSVGHKKERREKLVGPSVNLAAHLCQAANELAGGVLICRETAELIRPDSFEVKPVNLPIGNYFQVVTNTAE